MKKLLKISVGVMFGAVLFIGCGEPVFTLNNAMEKGFDIKQGMTRKQVKHILKLEPTLKKRDGDFEVWIYEGEFTNENTGKTKYKNITIKFKNGKVIYPGYFECPVPKVGN